MSPGYVVAHKDEARKLAKLRERLAADAALERAKQAELDAAISALLRADTEHLRPVRKPT
jgi:hypothetical protein